MVWGPAVDIFEQVDKVIKNLETRERKNQTGRLLEESLVLEEMTKRYRVHIEKGQWKEAQDCLEHISRLVEAILAK
jgi:hypothetical protein